MKAEDASRPLSEAVTAEPLSPAATETRAPYLAGAQNAASSLEQEPDPSAAVAVPSLYDGFLSRAAAPLSAVAATRESLWSLLSVRGLTVVFPALHRDYAQGRQDAQAEAVRRKLLDDLSDALRAAASDSAGLRPGMDLGLVCGNLEPDRSLIPVDGQQRLTTLFLLHWLLAFLSGRLESDPEIRNALLRFRFDGREPADRFCRRLVLQGPCASVPASGDSCISSRLRSCGWFTDDCERDLSVRGMLLMLDALEERLTSLFDEGFPADRLFALLTSAHPPVSFLTCR